MEKANILVVDDDKEIAELVGIHLREEGYEVYKAYSGKEALKIFKQERIDLVILDVMMPVMNGYEATKMIRSMDRSDAKKIPIIAMTANAFVEDRIKSKEAGMNEHVSKPIDMKLLVKIIAELAGKIKIVRIKDE